jgi:hypothetical protein
MNQNIGEEVIMVILNKEIKGPDMRTADGAKCFYKFKIGLSKNANPNIFVDEEGYPTFVMMHIQRTLYECMQDDTEYNAIENKSESVDVQCSIVDTQRDSLDYLYKDPFNFWLKIVERR